MEFQVDIDIEIPGQIYVQSMWRLSRAEEAAPFPGNMLFLWFFRFSFLHVNDAFHLVVVLFPLVRIVFHHHFRFQDKTVSLDVRLGALRLYRAHLVSQYADRCAYWALKDISSEVMAQTITITTDGADQVSHLLLHPILLIFSTLAPNGHSFFF